MSRHPQPILGFSASPVYDLPSSFASFASLLQTRRTDPMAGCVEPCDEAVDYALALGTLTFEQMIARVLQDAQNPAVELDAKTLSGWLRWCLEVQDVQMSPRLVAAYVMAVQELLPDEAITLFRLWLAVPEGQLSAAEEATLCGCWQGKLPRIEKMLQRGELTRAQ